nr:MAG TPA: hypothetical protein [Caudoviricetes sp.]
MLSHFYQPPFCNKKRAAFILLLDFRFYLFLFYSS